MSRNEKLTLVFLAFLIGVALAIKDARSQPSTTTERSPVPILRKSRPGPAPISLDVAPRPIPPSVTQRVPWFPGATRCVQQPGEALRCE